MGCPFFTLKTLKELIILITVPNNPNKGDKVTAKNKALVKLPREFD